MISVERYAKKNLAVLLAAATLVASPGNEACRAFATDVSAGQLTSVVDPAMAAKDGPIPLPDGFLDRLQAEGFITGPDDPLVKAIVYSENGGQNLTLLGHFLLRYEGLKSEASPQSAGPAKGSPDFARLDDELRKSLGDFRQGKVAGDQRAASSAIFQMSVELRQAGIKNADYLAQVHSGPPNPEMDYANADLSALRMQGAKVKAVEDTSKPPKLTPVAAAGKVWFYDPRHQLYAVTDMDGKVLQSRDLQKQQEAFNRENIPGAPHLNETGVYDVDTLKIPFYEFQLQLSQLKRSFHFDRTLALAELLGKDKSLNGDQYDPENQDKEKSISYTQRVLNLFKSKPTAAKTLEQELEETRPGEFLPLSGHQAREFLDPLFQKREEYTARAEQAMNALAEAADAARGNQISQSVIDAISTKRWEAQRLFWLSALYGELYQVKHSKSKLTGKDMRELLNAAPGTKEQLEALRAHVAGLAARMDTVGQEFEDVIARLEGLSFALPPGDKRLAALADKLDKIRLQIPVVEDDSKEAAKAFGTLSTVLSAYTASDKSSRMTWHIDAPGFGIHTIFHPLGEAMAYSGVASVQAYDAVARGLAPTSKRAQQSADAAVGTNILQGSFNRLVAGDIDGANASMRDLDPDAWKTCWSPASFGAASEPTDDDKISCSVQSYMKKLGDKAKVDAIVSMVGQLTVSAIGMSALAGVEAGALTRIGTAWETRGVALAGEGGLAWVAGNGLRMGGQILLQSGGLLAKISATGGAPAWLQEYGPLLRAFNAGRTQMAVAGQLALISGTMSLGRAELDPHTPFKSGLDAFKTGAQGGAQWAIENPWMLYVGVPGNIFGKTNWVGRAFSNFGDSGVVGGLSKSFLKEDYVMKAAGWMDKAGVVGKFASFGLTTTDAVGKFWVGGEIMSGLAKPLAYQYDRLHNPDPGTPEGFHNVTPEQLEAARARIDYAESAGMAALNWGWLLLPARPEENAGAIQESRLARQGYQVYQDNGEAHLLVGKSGQEMPLNAQPITPFMDTVYGHGGEQSVADKVSFRVTSDMDVRATRQTLETVAPTVPEMFHASRLEDGQKLGQLLPQNQWKDPAKPEYKWAIEGSDNVREQGQKLLEEMALKDPHGTRESLKTADPALKDQLTRIYMEAYPSRVSGAGGVLDKLMDLARGLGSTFSQGQRDRDAILDDAMVVQGPKLKTEAMVDAKGKTFVDAVARLPKLTDAFKARVEDLLRRTQEWRQAAEKGDKTPYVEVAGKWNAEVQEDAALDARQKEALGAMTEYVSALQGRFNDSEIRDLKSTRIASFRPKQQQVLMNFLGRFALAGSQGAESAGWLKRFARKAGAQGDLRTEVARHYLLLATGGGKTLLAFEGILPVAKADAAAKGTKLAYMTANSNLVTQARLDYKAFGRLLTPLEIITMDEFSTRIARSRLLGGERPQDYYLMADELDKIAEDPVKTVGRESMSIARENETYRGLAANAEKIESSAELALTSEKPGAGTYARRLARFFIGDWSGDVTSGERGARARADLGSLKAERDRLMDQASILHEDEVADLEHAIDLKKSELKRAQPAADRVAQAKAKLAKAAGSGAGEEALKPLREELDSAGDALLQAQEDAKEKVYGDGERESPLDLDSLETALAAVKNRRAAAAAQFEQMRADSDAMLALADKGSEVALLDGPDATRLAARRKSFADRAAALGDSAQPSLAALKEFDALMAEAKAPMTDVSGLPEALAPSRLHDRAKAEKLRDILAQRADALSAGKKAEADAFAADYKKLLPEAIDVRDWKEQFRDLRDAWTQQLAAVPRDTRAALDAAAAGRADKLDALWNRYGADFSPERREALRAKVADGGLTPDVLREIVSPFEQRQTRLLEKASASEAALTPYRLRDADQAQALAQIPSQMADVVADRLVEREALRGRLAQAESLEDIERVQSLSQDADKADAAGTRALDALQARHEALLPEAVGTDRLAELRQIGRSYRRGLEQSVLPANRMYAVFQDYDRKVGRLMDSPARVGSRERREWVADIRATGDDMLAALNAAAAKQAKSVTDLWKSYDPDIEIPQARREELMARISNGTLTPADMGELARPFTVHLDKLLAKAEAPAAVAKEAPKPSLPVRGAAKAAEIKSVVARMQAAGTAGDAAGLKSLVDKYELLHLTEMPVQAPGAEIAALQDEGGPLGSVDQRMKGLLERMSDPAQAAKPEALKALAAEYEVLQRKAQEAALPAPAEEVAGAQGPRTLSSYQFRYDAEGRATKAAELKDLSVKVVEAAASGDADAAKAYADRFEKTIPQAVWAVDWAADANRELDGLSKGFAAQLIDALYDIDPALGASSPKARKALLAYKRFMGEGELTSAQRNELYYQLADSEKTGQGWARTELVNLMHGRLEDPAHVRYDRSTGKVFSVHVGQWMERMDTPTRRYWELQYGADLTMPFKHETEATARDILNNPEMNVVGFSGTVQRSLGLGKKGLSGKALNFEFSGEESEKQPAELREHSTSSLMFQSAADLIRENMKSEESLTFIGFKNTRDLKIFRELLRRNGVADESVASIFSDTEFLRTQRPKAEVKSRMNLDGMKTGKVKVVLMDMLVGGRGLDLDFRSYGQKMDADGKPVKDAEGKTVYEDGKGYKNVDMVILNPETMSPGHYVQFQGRIATDRVAPGASRRFFDFIDMDAALKDPKLLELARKEDKPLDAAFIEAHLDAAQLARQRELLENSRSVRPGQLTGYGLMDQVLADVDAQKLAKAENKAGRGALDARFVAERVDALLKILDAHLDKELAEAKAGSKKDKTELLREVYDIPALRELASSSSKALDADFIAANRDKVREAIRAQLLDDSVALQRNPRWATGLSSLEN